MTEITLTPTRFENALWEAHIAAETEPRVEAVYLGAALPDVALIQNAEGWTLRVPVPNAALSDGVHCIVIYNQDTKEKLGDFTIIAGEPAAADLRAEIGLLRAELDMLKRAFRRTNTPED